MYGRNVQVCCESCSMSLADATGSFLSNRVIADCVQAQSWWWFDEEQKNCVTELMIRDDMLQVSSDVFNMMDIRDVISFYELASLCIFLYLWYLCVFLCVF